MPLPPEVQALAIPSGTRSDQEYLGELCARSVFFFPQTGKGQGPRTLALRARQRFVYTELTGRGDQVLVDAFEPPRKTKKPNRGNACRVQHMDVRTPDNETGILSENARTRTNFVRTSHQFYRAFFFR